MPKSQHTPKYRKLILELKVARIRAGMTQLEVAAKLKTYKMYVGKIESGERKLDVIELEQLCKVYGIKVSELLHLIGIE